jgi:hypothetical protein
METRGTGKDAPRATGRPVDALAVAGTYRRTPSTSRCIIRLSVSAQDLATQWRLCGVTADFVAEFFARRCRYSESMRNSLSTILNEMVENAVKFSQPANSTIEIALFGLRDEVVLQVDNSAREAQAEQFVALAKDLAGTPDIESLYLQTIKREMRPEEASRLGLLTLVHDFGVGLGVKLMPGGGPGTGNVSVQVRLIPEEALA